MTRLAGMTTLAMDCMIKLSHISKTFDDDENFIVKDLSLHIETGETLVLLGSSGCGKTTTLKMINRLVEPTSGEIEINAKNIKLLDPVLLRRSIGYVFQGIGLFPHMTVEENISIVLRLEKKSVTARKKRAHELLNLINLNPDEYAERLPEALSGGQRQRVGVARALASDPEILLMDEPFGALDAITRENLQNELVNLKKKLQKTIVFVTHDILEAFRIGDRIAIMDKGVLQQVGSKKEILEMPATGFVKELLQRHLEQLKEYITN